MTRALSPRSLDEAVRALADDPGLLPVAGCTDLMVSGVNVARDRNVLDVTRIPELHGIRTHDRGLRIGAAVTFTEIGRDPEVNRLYPILARAAGVVGGWQIQNRATLAGNVANASPAGDSLPVLLALDAVVVLAGPDGTREVPYDAFHLDYRKTALRPGEIITGFHIPRPHSRSFQRFTKVGTREAQAISKVVVAFVAGRDGDELQRVRLAAGSVAPMPVRLRITETLCESRIPDRALADRAAESARKEVHPITDVRSTAEYRRFVLGRVVRRMILDGSPT